MQLGAWVEFDQIVVRTKTAQGSQPAVQSLGRTRRGVVIGMRQVYEVEAGSPPLLTNPQTVLLIAVSLHRRYRVFPADLRPAAAPQPKRRRSVAPAPQAMVAAAGPQAAGSTTLTITGDGSSRDPIAPSDLDLLVANEISRLVAAAEIYTAYDVTLALRAAHPDLDISHEAVRSAVHDQMEPILASRLYDREVAQFGRNQASRYVPA
jgi:hypothetical protein